MQFHHLWLNNTSILKHVQSLVWFIEDALRVDCGGSKNETKQMCKNLYYSWQNNNCCYNFRTGGDLKHEEERTVIYNSTLHNTETPHSTSSGDAQCQPLFFLFLSRSNKRSRFCHTLSLLYCWNKVWILPDTLFRLCMRSLTAKNNSNSIPTDWLVC